MTELTLEALSKRIEELERRIENVEAPKKDWRRSVGMFDGSDFMKQVDAECAAMREAERQAAREGYEDYAYHVIGTPLGRREPAPGESA